MPLPAPWESGFSWEFFNFLQSIKKSFEGKAIEQELAYWQTVAQSVIPDSIRPPGPPKYDFTNSNSFLYIAQSVPVFSINNLQIIIRLFASNWVSGDSLQFTLHADAYSEYAPSSLMIGSTLGVQGTINYTADLPTFIILNADLTSYQVGDKVAIKAASPNNTNGFYANISIQFVPRI